MSEPPAGVPHVLVVGAGFGGLRCVRALAHAPVRLTLVDRTNHHLFQPMLYEVATSVLGANEIAAATRHLFRHQRNVAVHMTGIERVDLAAKCAFDGEGRATRYDWLVLAPGVVTDYFGHADWAEHAPGLKSLDDALVVRRRVLMAFERAEITPDPAARRALLTFVIVGAGATGVELAGAIGELANFTLRHDFRAIDPREAQVLLLDAGERVLPSFAPSLSARARRDLERLGVTVRTGVRVGDIGPGFVVAGDERIATEATIWSAGTRGAPLLGTLGTPLDRQGRAIVGPDGALPGHPEVFVVGDAAHVEDARFGTLPGVAQVAMQMGTHAARCIRADLDARPRRAFAYFDKGQLAVIGRGHAVLQVGPVRLAGFPAWIAWALVHVTFLIGFRNRVITMLEWARTYFFHRRAGRVIVGGD
jgi:NADH dehydrogenase